MRLLRGAASGLLLTAVCIVGPTSLGWQRIRGKLTPIPVPRLEVTSTSGVSAVVASSSMTATSHNGPTSATTTAPPVS